MIRRLKIFLWNLVLFLLGVACALYVLFPSGRLETVLRTEVQRRLPEPVILHELELELPLGLRGEFWLNHQRLPATVELPFQLTASPGLNSLELAVHSLPERRLSGQIKAYARKAHFSADKFQLNRVIPGQPGSFSGQVQGRWNEKLTGELSFSLNAPRLVESSAYPPLARGRPLQKFQVAGKFEERTVNLDKIMLQSGELNLTGRANLELRQPFPESRLRFDGELRGMINREVSRELKLREIGI